MTIYYYVAERPVLEFFQFDHSRIPHGLVQQAQEFEVEGRRELHFIVGTRRGNPKVADLLLNYRLDPRHYQRLGISSTDVVEMLKSGRPYYSKDGLESPLLPLDKSTRFIWDAAGPEFWKQLPRDTKIISFGGPNIKTLGGLLDALEGPNSNMVGIVTSDYPSYWTGLQ